MSTREQLVIRWPQNPGGSFSWAVVDAQGKPQGKILEGALSTCAATAAGRRVTVLVPGVDVLLSRARVPTKNRRRLLQALPYAMEEQLSEDIGELHFALGQQDDNGEYPVAVVAKSKMTSWLTTLEEAGLTPDAIAPEVLAIPLGDQQWSLLVHGDRALLRRDESTGLGCDSDALPALLDLVLAEAGDNRPRAIRLYAPKQASQLPLRTEIGISHTAIEHPLQALLPGVGSGGTLNLLQGEYSRRDQAQKLLRPWRAVAAVLAAWFLLQGGITLFEIQQMKGEVAALDQQIEQTFRATFPAVKRIVNPRLQMEQQLKALRGQGEQRSALGLLAGVGEVLQSHRTAQLNAVSFRGGTLDLDLELNDLQVLDRIKQQTAEKLKMPVEIVSAAAQKEKVAGRLRVGGGS